jgi:hypothetical protein
VDKTVSIQPRNTKDIQRNRPDSKSGIMGLRACPKKHENKYRSGKLPKGRRTNIGGAPRERASPSRGAALV